MVATSVKGRALPRLTARDRQTLELRRVLPLPGGEAPVTHLLDVYFFFPRGFGVDDRTWGTSGYYRDAKMYLRVTAQGLSLADLADLKHPLNPGALLVGQLENLFTADAPSGRALASLARVYGAEVADAFEVEGLRLRALLDAASGKGKKKGKKGAKNPKPDGAKAEGKGLKKKKKISRRLKRLEEDLERFLTDSLHALAAVRRIRGTADAYRGVAFHGIFSSLAFAEEYATSVLDEELAALARRIEQAPELHDGEGTATRLRLRIAHAANVNNQRRIDEGFAVPWGKSQEFFSYRIGLLKKELQRTLYLDTRRLARDPLYTNTAAVVAAGLAATWATLAQLPLWTGGFTTRQGMFFLAAAVGAYMVKDRIKEWTRGMLARRLIAWDHDRKIKPGALEEAGLGSFTGRARERVAFERETVLPDAVRSLRQAFRTVEGTTYALEEIVHYRRSVTLEPPGDGSTAAGLGVQELLRLSLTDVLRRLDEPRSRAEFFDPVSGRFVEREIPRVYHLNVITVAREEGSERARLQRHRVVVDREGVVRIEPVAKLRVTVPVPPRRFARLRQLLGRPVAWVRGLRDKESGQGTAPPPTLAPPGAEPSFTFARDGSEPERSRP